MKTLLIILVYAWIALFLDYRYIPQLCFLYLLTCHLRRMRMKIRKRDKTRKLPHERAISLSRQQPLPAANREEESGIVRTPYAQSSVSLILNHRRRLIQIS